MTPKVVNERTPDFVVSRFPHLETKLNSMVSNDESFRQLCFDYQDLVNALNQKSTQSSETREDLLGLKTSLEVEILEQVTRE